MSIVAKRSPISAVSYSTAELFYKRSPKNDKIYVGRYDITKYHYLRHVTRYAAMLLTVIVYIL